MSEQIMGNTKFPVSNGAFKQWLQQPGQKIKLQILLILMSYLVLGITVLGFNRSPLQMAITTISCMALEVILSLIIRRKIFFPLSGLITSCSLSILLNYSHDYFLLLVPVYFAIGSKYFFTFEGRHVFNPAQIAVSLSLLFCGHLITAAPSYQWNGIESFGVFIVMLGVFIILPGVKRTPLVLSFLIVFMAQTFLRATIMKYHLPFETLFLGTLTSPAFFLFTFFMITDPATSPSGTKQQIIVGSTLAILDLVYHIGQSYFTFFYAAFTLQSIVLLSRHFKASRANGLISYFRHRFFQSGYYRRFILILGIGYMGVFAYQYLIKPKIHLETLPLKMVELPLEKTGLKQQFGNMLTEVDPRIHHLAKWVLSVGDAVGTGDVNNDGLQDIFLTAPLKTNQDRNSLFINQGNFEFKKVPIPALEKRTANYKRLGLPSNAIFIDYDNDKDQDLFISYAFGTSVLLKNTLSETGELSFVDVTLSSGLANYTNSITAIFFDINKDGLLDLIIGNVWPKHLPDYNPARKLNLFKLPEAEYEGDERMFNFMHSSWHLSDNGGLNDIYLQTPDHTFSKQDSKQWGFKDTYWTLAFGASDFNQDGYLDLYVSNDFGPDEFYLNKAGKGFQIIKGKVFGDIGLDTYKGMNTTIGDFDGNGRQDIHISNVHHAMQAEGSMMWMNYGVDKKGVPILKDQATQMGILNEQRFGWGATAADFNNDGMLDMAQANGMVDDLVDKKYETCRDYWYVNEKIARSAPHIHKMANKWGDIRGYCIYGKELNRLYLNRGNKKGQRFIDIAELAGMNKKTNSRGVAATDFNNDGHIDLLFTHQFHSPTFYHNQPLKKGNWIAFELKGNGQTCNRDAINTRVVLTAGDQKQLREVFSVNGFSAQSDRRIHFGVADYRGKVSLEVDWCGKGKDIYHFDKLNQYYNIEQKSGPILSRK